MKTHFISAPLLFSGALLTVFLFFRVTRGLDVSDEMQYYGQIKGLVETGRLFTTDMFVQQAVYALFYPAFRAHSLAFGPEGLIFFGRILISLIHGALFLWAYRRLLALRFPALVAGATALSCVIPICSSSAFAVSYNTVSQAMWAVFIVKFFDWDGDGDGDGDGLIFWVAWPCLMVAVYPTSAVAMAVLVFGRLVWERRYGRIARWAMACAGGGLAVLGVLLNFASPREYLASLDFTMGSGAGSLFFSSLQDPLRLAWFLVLHGAAAVFRRRFSLKFLAGVNVGFLAMALAAVMLSPADSDWGHSHRVAYIGAILSTAAYAWALSSVDHEGAQDARAVHWTAVLVLAFAATLSATSANGFIAAITAFLAGLPIFIAVAVRGGTGGIPASPGTPAFLSAPALLAALYLANVALFPYRDEKFWRAVSPIEGVPEFRYIRTSPQRAEFFRNAQTVLGPLVRRKRALLVGDFPALYFVLGAVPDTCMIYMHSIASDRGGQSLLGCLRNKAPEVVVDFSREGTRLRAAIRGHFAAEGYTCGTHPLEIPGTGYEAMAIGQAPMDPVRGFENAPFVRFEAYVCTRPAKGGGPA